MLDLAILRMMKHKDNFDRLYPNLPSDALAAATMQILEAFDKFFKETEHPVIKTGPFKALFFSFYKKNLKQEEADYYNKLIDRLEKDIDENTMRVISNQLVELSFATDVANDAADYHDGKDIDIIHSVGDRHESARAAILRGDADELHVGDCILDLLAEDQNTDGLCFRLACLRDGLRPLRGGDFVIAAGRPDIGKTSFILSEVGHMASQLQPERPVVWFNNEGQGNRIIKRAYQAVLGATIDELLALKQAGNLQREYDTALGNTALRVVDCHDWDTGMIENVIEQLSPGLVVFDMIDNIEFKGAKRDARTDQVLEGMYQWARKLGVKYDCPIIAASQVSADAEQSPETQCYPAQHMLKDSKTGKQGAADLMIMVGKSDDPTMQNARFISTPKNKLATGPVYIRAQVNFDGPRSRYNDPV